MDISLSLLEETVPSGRFCETFLQRETNFSFSGVSVIIAELHLLLLGSFCETLALGYGLISARSSSSFSV